MVPDGAGLRPTGIALPTARPRTANAVSGRPIVSAKWLYRTPDPIASVTTISSAQTLSAAFGRPSLRFRPCSAETAGRAQAVSRGLVAPF